jgi:hypothetical protein
MDSSDLKDVRIVLGIPNPISHVVSVKISGAVTVIYNDRVKKEREDTKGRAKKSAARTSAFREKISNLTSAAAKKAILQLDSELSSYRDDDMDSFM